MDYLRSVTPLLIAHRGARREAPENTMPAFVRAMELGAEGIEFDVLLTSDRVPTVTHNDDLSILTCHRGYAHLTPFATVKMLDAGSHFSPKFAGVTMPTFVEVLETIRPHNILAIVEIKHQPGMAKAAARLIGGILSDFKMNGPVMVSSSSLRIVHELKVEHPKIPRALILKQKHFSFFRVNIFAKFESLAAIHPSLGALNEDLVRRVHGMGCGVYAWTANGAKEFDFCSALGVNGIITDDIAFAKRHLKTATGC